MSDYLARPLSPGRWEVTKWDDDSQPLETYVLTQHRAGFRCSSPGCGGRPRCKHARVVEQRMREPLDEVPQRMYVA